MHNVFTFSNTFVSRINMDYVTVNTTINPYPFINEGNPPALSSITY